MATKTITITEDAYNRIKKFKEKDESFSEMFKRTFKKTTRVSDLRGLFKDIDAEKMKAKVKKMRKEATIAQRERDARLRQLSTD